MKILFITVLMIFSFSVSNAQKSFTGARDNKLSVMGNFQKYATGINLAFDFGVTDNISLGLSSLYATRIKIAETTFMDRFDFRARFNANLSNVFRVDHFDVYPGFSAGLKNIGGHVGFRYFLSNGFGVTMEFMSVLGSYKVGEKLTPTERIHNQFSFNFGGVFNL